MKDDKILNSNVLLNGIMKTIQLQSIIVSQNGSVLEVLHDYISTRGFTVLSINSRDTPIRLSIVSIHYI